MFAARRSRLLCTPLAQRARASTRLASGFATGARSTGSVSTAIFVGCLASTAVGYILAKSKYERAPDARAEFVEKKSKYGGPEDFAAAIEELRATLPSGAVSTQADDVDGHGNSPSIPHDGMCRTRH
jgi:D-lactate dehydrogenase (cytochrome)